MFFKKGMTISANHLTHNKVRLTLFQHIFDKAKTLETRIFQWFSGIRSENNSKIFDIV